ncbi:MAG: hypothetical protein K940chlam9_00099 [Chlamydiae bacterium]|nr:hypothetical protein [Chlamydiota bacterium]
MRAIQVLDLMMSIAGAMQVVKPRTHARRQGRVERGEGYGEIWAKPQQQRKMKKMSACHKALEMMITRLKASQSLAKT